MPFMPFSKKKSNEFLSRTEDNFNILIDKIQLFYKKTRFDIGEGNSARRKLKDRFDYEDELNDINFSQKGITTEEVASEFNEMLQGCIRHQDPRAAFNIIPAPLLDVIAGITLVSLYNPNACWDFVSGKLCLFEKKIVRMLGKLVGWLKADGFVVTGGKQAILYAIKNGIGRASQNSVAEMSDYVVICSELAHYSIEHVCHYLGISSENCLRVKANACGEMDIQALEIALSRVIIEGKQIAAVIAVGGATVNLIPDSIVSIKETLDRTAIKFQLNYVPYLHVDSVISWTWLAFAKVSNNDWKDEVNPQILTKIENVLSKLSGIQYVDSFAVDFHKTGFCPYAAGVFIAKESSNLTGMALGRSILKEEMRFGENEIYRQTLENSRSGLAITSIWIALRRMGLEGLRNFVLYQLEVCEMFKHKIRESYSAHFEIINECSNGWEIVLKPHFGQELLWDQLQKASANEIEEYVTMCHLFLNSLWYEPLNNNEYNTPVIGFVKNYSKQGSYQKSFPAFLIHPCSVHYDNDTIDEMLEGIVRAKILFDNQMLAVTSISSDSYLHRVIPPR